jgi:hypothetical protein
MQTKFLVEELKSGDHLGDSGGMLEVILNWMIWK